MAPTDLPPAIFPSDEGDGATLYVFPMGNGDWYVATHPEQFDRLPFLDDGHVVRFSTSGSQMPDQAVLCVALLHDIATDNLDNARFRAQALVEQLTDTTGGK